MRDHFPRKVKEDLRSYLRRYHAAQDHIEALWKKRHPRMSFHKGPYLNRMTKAGHYGLGRKKAARGRRAAYPPVSQALGEAYTEIKPGHYVLEAPYGKFMVRAVVKKFGKLGWSWGVILHGKRIAYGTSHTQSAAFYRVEEILRYALPPAGARGRRASGRRAGREVNPYSKRYTFAQFKKRYFKNGPVPNAVAKEFWSDFRYAFQGGLQKYIDATTGQAARGRRNCVCD